MVNELIALRGDRSREEVAKALEISASALAMYELGYRVPRDEIKRRMADYYGVSIQELFNILMNETGISANA